jgi:predicted flap endonuclease-1-like 5' DNA nuclease
MMKIIQRKHLFWFTFANPFAGRRRRISWWFWVQLAAGVMILLWLWIRSQEEVESPEPEKLSVVLPPDDQVEATAPAESAPPTEVDDLKRLWGIGPKISAVLVGAGIQTYAQLAEMDADHLRQIMDAAGIRIGNPESWPTQAKMAAAGDWAGLEAFLSELHHSR